MRNDLTSQQHNELVEQFVEMVVDNMDTQTLVNYVFMRLSVWSPNEGCFNW